MLDWLERGLARLRQEVEEGEAWGRFMLRQAVEETLEDHRKVICGRDPRGEPFGRLAN